MDLKPENAVYRINSSTGETTVRLIGLDSATTCGNMFPVRGTGENIAPKYTPNYVCPEVYSTMIVGSNMELPVTYEMDYFNLGLVAFQLLNKEPKPWLPDPIEFPSEYAIKLSFPDATSDIEFKFGTMYTTHLRKLLNCDPIGRKRALNDLQTAFLSNTETLQAKMISEQQEIIREKEAIIETMLGSISSSVCRIELSLGQLMDSFVNELRALNVSVREITCQCNGADVMNNFTVKLDQALALAPTGVPAKKAVSCSNDDLLTAVTGQLIDLRSQVAQCEVSGGNLDSMARSMVQNTELLSLVLSALHNVYATSTSAHLDSTSDVKAEHGGGDNKSLSPTAAIQSHYAPEASFSQAVSVTASADTETNYQLGLRYYNGRGMAKNFSEAARYYKLAADQGHARSQCSLGVCYENGQGVNADFTEAARYYKLAADQSHAAAQCKLGVCYENGRGVASDVSEAARLFKLAADQGYADAQNSIGVCYKNGQGVTKDLSKSARCYRMAADQGHADAQNNLGLCYKHGAGVAKDFSKAVFYYRLAADQDHVAAQCNLGVCYKFGQGVTKDLSEAAHYSKLAAEQGYAEAQYNLGLCYKNGEGVTKDRSLARSWLQKSANQGHNGAINALRSMRSMMGVMGFS